MIKKLLLSLSIILFTQFGFSQCRVSATNFGNNTVPSYDVSGDVNITLNSNNTIRLDLGSNFRTGRGPDIRAFLVKSDGLSDAALSNSLIDDLENIEFGLVGCSRCSPEIPQNGAKSFTVNIPTGVNIQEYDTIFFYCLEFNAFWDFGKFTPFNSSNCNFLSVDENALNNIAIYPNPTSNVINISGRNQESLEISVFDVLGQPVLVNKNVAETLNVSHLNKGIYLLKISNQERTITKKLMVE